MSVENQIADLKAQLAQASDRETACVSEKPKSPNWLRRNLFRGRALKKRLA